MAQIEIPHVLKALLEILTAMSVAKNGELPGNMGGKPYITAQDVSAEAKRQFVSKGLVVVPSERVVRHEAIVNKERISVLISIEGEYTIMSTADGSSVTVQGVGDGLAHATSVASNIASTNAMKNAMMRTFMITEQSIEDQAKAGQEDLVDKPEPRAVTTATKGATQRQDSPAAVLALQNEVREAWWERHGEGDEGYIALGNSKFGEPKDWATNQTKLKSLIKAIKAAEVA